MPWTPLERDSTETFLLVEQAEALIEPQKEEEAGSQNTRESKCKDRQEHKAR